MKPSTSALSKGIVQVGGDVSFPPILIGEAALLYAEKCGGLLVRVAEQMDTRPATVRRMLARATAEERAMLLGQTMVWVLVQDTQLAASNRGRKTP